MLLKNWNNKREYEVQGPVYENTITKIWCGTCNIENNQKAFVKILNYGQIENQEIRKELLEVSKQEANTLTKIMNCSARVPHLIDSWDDAKNMKYIIIMSQVPGVSLREWINSHKKEVLEPKDIFVRVKIVQQLCEIMRDLTNKNVWLVHRDLKPENIYINFNKKEKRWDVYIIDFGCANLNHVRQVGTTNYQAPEQIGIKDSGVRIDSAVDIFAIGQIFYELLIGRAPVIGEDYTYKAKDTEWKQIPGLPDYLLQINGTTKLYETAQKMTAFKAENRVTFGRAITSLKNVRIG
jgi:serine/threonine protein kinase